MQRPTFRVKRYSHRKYKFLVRWKALGKWRRRYFVNETEAFAFADARNAASETELNGDSAKEVEDAPRQNGFKPGEGAGDRVENLANAGIRNVHSVCR